MTGESMATALKLLKTRLNRADGHLDSYLETRLNAELKRFAKIGIALTDTADDIMLLVDMTAWAYSNRDQPGSMPEWLRLARRERWLKEGGAANTT